MFCRAGKSEVGMGRRLPTAGQNVDGHVELRPSDGQDRREATFRITSTTRFFHEKIMTIGGGALRRLQNLEPHTPRFLYHGKILLVSTPRCSKRCR